MMVRVEATGTLERRMRVELPAERIEQEVETRLKKVGRTARIKGFRPGKVPTRVVRQRFGGQIRQEVLSELMQQSYSDAVQQEKLNPAAGPRIEPVPAEDGKSFAYVATFEVLPEIELKDLDKIKVVTPEVEITDEDREDMLTNLRQQKATWEAAEREAKEGDRVIVDFEGKLDGEPVKGGQGTGVPVVLGLGHMLPEFEKALNGMRAGEEKDFQVTFPEDYHAAHLAGKTVDFHVRVERVEEQKLPPLDDSLAELYGVTEGGLEQLRQDVVANMRREANERVRADVKEQVLKGLLETNPIEVPKSLVEREMHAQQHEAMHRLGIEDPAKAPPVENFRELAERSVRLGLLLRQVIEDAGLTLDHERLKRKVEDICSSYEDPEAMAASWLGNRELLARLEPIVLEEQAVDWLVEQGEASSRKVGFREYMKPQGPATRAT
ncbi:MAG TPA: trigger factor [Woeseiaceae bacterium]|nr:trigger factor [Woeseiaceae bacterium]